MLIVGIYRRCLKHDHDEKRAFPRPLSLRLDYNFIDLATLEMWGLSCPGSELILHKQFIPKNIFIGKKILPVVFILLFSAKVSESQVILLDTFCSAARLYRRIQNSTFLSPNSIGTGGQRRSKRFRMVA